MAFWAALNQATGFLNPDNPDYLLLAVDVIIIISSIWVAVEASLAMRRAAAEPPEEVDADVTYYETEKV